jgi:hypothetical protein
MVTIMASGSSAISKLMIGSCIIQHGCISVRENTHEQKHYALAFEDNPERY